MIHRHAHASEAAGLPFSLLRLSASTRLSGAALLVAALWAAVFWALR